MGTLFDEFKEALENDTFTEEKKKALVGELTLTRNKIVESIRKLDDAQEKFLYPKDRTKAEKISNLAKFAREKISIWKQGVAGQVGTTEVVGKKASRLAIRNVRKARAKLKKFRSKVEEQISPGVGDSLDDVDKLFTAVLNKLVREKAE